MRYSHSKFPNWHHLLSIPQPNMTPVIDKLVEEGLVTRDYDPTDRRVTKI